MGGPTGAAVRAGTAAVEAGGDGQRATGQEEAGDTESESQPTAQDEAASPEAEAANYEAVGAAAELIAKPRFELSSAEREVRDSISYGDAFKALRAEAEGRGDNDAVAELDAVSGEVSSALEAETMARARNDSEAFAPIREQLQSASERFTRVMDRLNAPRLKAKPPRQMLTKMATPSGKRRGATRRQKTALQITIPASTFLILRLILMASSKRPNWRKAQKRLKLA